jgi:hypothetical protein
MKEIANEIFSAFERYKAGQCSYDRALEDAGKLIKNYSEERPIIGYIKSNTLKKILGEILQNKKRNFDRPYMYDCQMHQNEVEAIERMYSALTNK